ncbi:hypothetical protein JCM11754A_31440 [Isoptericola variabilis]
MREAAEVGGRDTVPPGDVEDPRSAVVPEHEPHVGRAGLQDVVGGAARARADEGDAERDECVGCAVTS